MPGSRSPGGKGSNTVLTSRFARLRVRVAHGEARRREPAAEEWLLIEWPDGEAAPDHYWLSTLPADITFEHLVDLAKLRWRIERDYLELKQEVGLDHYKGRGWRGFHHHASLCIAAYGFLISETETIPPSGSARASRSAVPAGYRPRGAAVALPAHVPNSIATLRIRLARTLVGVLPRCPCCGRMPRRSVRQIE